MKVRLCDVCKGNENVKKAYIQLREGATAAGSFPIGDFCESCIEDLRSMIELMKRAGFERVRELLKVAKAVR